jgi:hypothetical protein
MTRSEQNFPSRQYSYSAGRRAGLADLAEPTLVAGRTYRFVLGRDPAPVLLEAAEGRERLHDLFAQLVLFSGGTLPMTARALVAQLDALNENAAGLPRQRSFMVADGGQIPWTAETDDLRRQFRFVITRQGATAGQPDLIVSTGTELESESIFLQVVGWDAISGAFQFYERRHGAWVWAGSSWDALEDDARGQGPFDSHVNGALNMKELKQPWMHWHSMAAQIRDRALKPGDPLLAEPLWTDRQGAELFEIDVARPGIRRWTAARSERSIAGGRLTRLPTFMRQVLETTTINLVSSPESFASLGSVSKVRLPVTFFVAADALFDVIGLGPDVQIPTVPSEVYREVVRRFDVHLQERTHRVSGDGHFVFAVPEPAFEDVVVLELLVDKGVLSRRLAASLLMVDFTNPVFSAQRAALMAYVPASAAVDDPDAFEADYVGAVERSPRANVAGSPEHEFLAHWALADAGQGWRAVFERRIEEFFVALTPALVTADGFSPLFELADSRRREFRQRKLAEFSLTLPFSTIPPNAPFLALTPAGRVVQK